MQEDQRKFYNENAEEYIQKLRDPRMTIPRKELYASFDCKGKSILDLGCGNGVLLEYLKDFKKYVGVDYSDALVEIANKAFGNAKVSFIQGDIRQKLDLKEKFDVIILNDIIHHTDFCVLKFPKEYLAENGVLILSEPILKDCKGKNFKWIWFNQDTPPYEPQTKSNFGNTKYGREHPPDFEFSIPEIKKSLQENGYTIVWEKSAQYNVIPFINRTNKWLFVKANYELEKLLIKLSSRFELQGSRYSAIVKAGSL